MAQPPLEEIGPYAYDVSWSVIAAIHVYTLWAIKRAPF